jgi:phosphoribosylformimino-5-aminoimidazole carboxamide ribotide isomerase
VIVIPAIDIREGKCVRLMRGMRGSETTYSDNPAEMARRWESKGAELLHIVDLDGAFDGEPRNMESIRQIVNSVHIPVQVGGGIRNRSSIATYMDMGVERIVLGTAIFKSPGLFREVCDEFSARIIVAIDARDNMVTIEGWTETTGVGPIEFVTGLEELDLVAVIYTDTHRDGMQVGLDLEGIRQLAESTPIPVIASGGVSGIEDIEALLTLEDCGVVGIITGKAIYSGSLELEQAIRVAKRGKMV